jgi:Xaa-Pro aminopeptidase
MTPLPASTPRAKPLPPQTPLAVFKDRITRLRAALKPLRLSFALITNPADVAYLTGFLGGDSYLLVGPSSCTIISDFRYQEELAAVEPLAEVHIRAGSLAAAVGDVFRLRRASKAAVQAEYLSLAEHKSLAKAVGGSARLVPSAGLLQPLRALKHPAEVALIRAAADIQQAALLATLPTIRPGQSELDVAARLEFEMKSRGSTSPAFETIVAARTNGSLPHYRPQAVRLASYQPLLIDWGATVRGYRSDMTRTFALGRWPARLKEVYAVVLDAHLAAAAALRHGATTRDVDAVARTIITRAGYGDSFGHGLGHGIGLNVHEDPRLSHMTPPKPLEQGMVVTIEPGIYLPGLGGVRLENDYLVTARGSQCLCSLPLDIDWATL